MKNILKLCVLPVFLIFANNAAHAFLTDLHGSYSFLTVGGSDVVNTYNDTSIAFLDGVDQSVINVNGGTISWLSLYDNNVTNIYNGDISWLVVDGDARVNIFGTGFNYSGGHLSGFWAGGKAFSFWAIKDFGLASNLMPENIILQAPVQDLIPVEVPESSMISLFLIGLLLVGFRQLQAGR